MKTLTKAVGHYATDPRHAPFLELLPKLQTHATIVFRTVRCPDQKADKICETIALAWKWYCRLPSVARMCRSSPWSSSFWSPRRSRAAAGSVVRRRSTISSPPLRSGTTASPPRACPSTLAAWHARRRSPAGQHQDGSDRPGTLPSRFSCLAEHLDRTRSTHHRRTDRR